MEAERGAPIFIGPFKGGSTSVGMALQSVGLSDVGWQPEALPETLLGVLAELNELVRSYPSVGDIPEHVRADVVACVGAPLRALMRGHNCASDWPMGHECIHPYIRKIVFPNCKFVFLTRERDAYVRSVELHGRHHDGGPIFDALWACGQLGATVAWARYQGWLGTYRALCEEFPNDVLIMNVSDGWTRLAAFVGLAEADRLAAQVFPWENRSCH